MLQICSSGIFGTFSFCSKYCITAIYGLSKRPVSVSGRFGSEADARNMESPSVTIDLRVNTRLFRSASGASYGCSGSLCDDPICVLIHANWSGREDFTGRSAPAWFRRLRRRDEPLIRFQIPPTKRKKAAPRWVRATLFSYSWSGREDSNLRPPAPHAGALPDCATPRSIGKTVPAASASKQFDDLLKLFTHLLDDLLTL